MESKSEDGRGELASGLEALELYIPPAFDLEELEEALSQPLDLEALEAAFEGTETH